MQITNPMPYDFKNWTRGNDVEEWGPHTPQDPWFLEWRWYTGNLVGADGVRYFLYLIFQPGGQGFYDPINAETGKNFSTDNPLTSVFYRLTNVESGETVFYHQEYTDSPYEKLYDIATKTWNFQGEKFSASLSWDGEKLNLRAEDDTGVIELTASGEARWYNDPALKQEGFMREGAGYTLYYSCPNMPSHGHYVKKDGSEEKRVEFDGRGWLDNQVCDLVDPSSIKWEWTGLLFADGDRINLYNFFHKDLQMTTWFKADGTREQTDIGFVQKQTGYTKLESGIWVSYGWEFEIPYKGKKYRVEPCCPNLMPAMGKPGGMLETIGKLFDENGNQVGWATTESMDVAELDNAPNGSRQL